jgi:hypothetical protein
MLLEKIKNMVVSTVPNHTVNASILVASQQFAGVIQGLQPTISLQNKIKDVGHLDPKPEEVRHSPSPAGSKETKV